MNGYIIYASEDVNKNRAYIDMHVNKFRENGITLKVRTLEQINKSDNIDFIINRSRSFEISEAFERKRITVFNSSRVTRIANNKGETYKFLKEIVPFMPVKYNDEIITSFINRDACEIGYPFVLKSCSGHGGSKVFMISNDEEMQEAVEEIGVEKFVVQQCCSDLGKDMRVYIIGNRIVASMLRSSNESFKSNFSLGGKVEKYELNDEEKSYIERIVNKISLDFGAIDFTFHNGKAVFNEIEDAAGSRMLYQNTDIDIVELQVEYMIDKLKQKA